MSTSSESADLREDQTELSQNEARVLHSLIRYPDLNDHEIINIVNIKKSTFSSIKARLREQDYFKQYYVPNFPKIGFELLHVLHGNLNRFSTFDERIRVAGDMLERFVEDFYVMSESNKAFNLSISQNYTEYAKNQEEFFKVYSSNNFLSRQGMESVSFPFALSRIRAFMDYEALVANFFGYESEPYGKTLVIPTGNNKKEKLSNAEKKVLLGLIKFSEESDTFIADTVGVSRNTVANAKKKFTDEKICFPRVVPNLQKLGLKLMVFTYRKFNANTTMSDRETAAELVRTHLAPFFYVSKNLDGFLISAHKSFEDYNRAMDEVMRFYLKKDYVSEEPKTYHMSISNTNIVKEFDFLPMTTKILNFDPDKEIAEH